jgi:hypothetical protein
MLKELATFIRGGKQSFVFLLIRYGTSVHETNKQLHLYQTKGTAHGN